MATQKQRQLIPIKEAFFNDGHWYVLSSSSLGGSGLTAAEIADKLQSEDKTVMQQLLKEGVCFPLFFDGDCALDDVAIVIGDLSEKEEDEWIGRIQSKLEIPCGEFMVMGGGMEEGFEDALPNDEAPDPHFTFFQKFKVEAGTYLVEVYAFLSSMTVNFHWDELQERGESIEEWCQLHHVAKKDYPEWMSFFSEEDYVDSEDFDLQEYIIRLTPLTQEVPLPELDEEYNWCGEFKIRRPEKCPQGLPNKDYRTTRVD
ncbi:MAG: hypothetical protein GQ569_12080 [Methylococcaceae bacterium]|nr:hypothetical protein [Methylococcaceae bacterium]